MTYSSGEYEAVFVVVADLNGDGKPDLVVANHCQVLCGFGGAVNVLLGNGDGTFQAAVTYDSGGYYAQSVAVADVNGDGKPDLVVANECTTVNSYDTCVGNGNVSVLLGNGDGTFQAAVTYNSGADQAMSVALADVNGNGTLDIIAANYSGVSGVLLGNG